MSEITDRLRRDGAGNARTEPLMLEAADTIEGLKKAITDMTFRAMNPPAIETPAGVKVLTLGTLVKLGTDIDILRKALEAMIEEYDAANEVMPAFYQARDALDKTAPPFPRVEP